jgi:hypothetical protein
MRAKHDSHGRPGQIRLIPGNFILPLREPFQTARRDGVERFDVERSACLNVKRRKERKERERRDVSTESDDKKEQQQQRSKIKDQRRRRPD